MESLLFLLGTLIGLFLIISAAAEAILEVIRGLYDSLGIAFGAVMSRLRPGDERYQKIAKFIAWRRSKVNLDDAIKMAIEFDSKNEPLRSTFEALEATVSQVDTLGDKYKRDIEELREQWFGPDNTTDEPGTRSPATTTAPGPAALYENDPDVTAPQSADDKQALNPDTPYESTGSWSKIALSVKADIDQYNRRRIFYARLLAGLIGCVLVWQLDFHVFRILAEAASNANYDLSGLEALQWPIFNIIAGGFAASVGSSYWHDHLNRVRHLKNAAKQAVAVKAP